MPCESPQNLTRLDRMTNLVNRVPSSHPPVVNEANRMHSIVIGSRVALKLPVLHELSNGGEPETRKLLRRWILDDLQGDYNALNTDRKRDVRCGLLSALGRLEDDDAEAAEYLRRNLAAEVEPNRWARYWTLEGLIEGGADDIESIAERLVEEEHDRFPRLLAHAVLAAKKQQDSIQALEQALGGEECDAALRALRVKPVQHVVAILCTILSSSCISVTTHDAIVAVSNIPATWPEAADARRALRDCVLACRRHPWGDSFRRKAIFALGRLQAKEIVPLLVEELADQDPSIVCEASRALQRVVGTQKAAARIVEAAIEHDESGIALFAAALRWLDAPGQVVQALERLALAKDPKQEGIVKRLLVEMGGAAAFNTVQARQDIVKTHAEALQKSDTQITALFESVLQGARTGYRIALGMDITVFLIGVAFLILCFVLVLLGKETLPALVAAGGGVLAVIYSLLIGNPRKRLVEAVNHLMGLQVLFLGYLRQVHHFDQIFTRHLLEDVRPSLEIAEQYSRLISQVMDRARSSLSTSPGPAHADDLVSREG